MDWCGSFRGGFFMRPAKITATVFEELKSLGCQAKIISSDHIRDLQKEIEGKYRKGLFDEAFYEEELTGFDFKIADRLTGIKSLIIVAAPQSQVRVTFTWQGNSYRCIIPPTYSYETDRKIQNLLERQLTPAGFHLEKAIVPWKLLAVHSGLARYGKNNITYVNGMGSYHRLAAFISDFPFPDDSWGKLRMMDQCHQCSACMKACPSSAIGPDRFLLHGERCLTFHNERQGEFPLWIKTSWHNCLVGCLYCQKVCPVNKEYHKITEEGPGFSEGETAFLLQGTQEKEIFQETVKKLEQQDMIEYLDVLGRNLQALIGKRKR
jgi:epoxyqueuosine reductase